MDPLHYGQRIVADLNEDDHSSSGEDKMPLKLLAYFIMHVHKDFSVTRSIRF